MRRVGSSGNASTELRMVAENLRQNEERRVQNEESGGRRAEGGKNLESRSWKLGARREEKAEKLTAEAHEPEDHRGLMRRT